MDNKKVVYASLLIKNGSTDILGIYSTEKKAIDRCFSEPSFTHSGWKKNDLEMNKWNNGYGLQIMIKTYILD